MFDADGNEYECYIKGTMELLTCKNFTSSELKILLRLSAFKTVFFEGAEKTAELLNLSVKTVQAAKRRFESLGILEEIEDHGHGKRYKVNKNLIDHPSEIFETAPKAEPKAEEPAKPRNPKDYGDEDVNELLGAWKDETGIDAFDNKLERKCARIILNKYGMEQALKLAKRVGAIQGVKYAPSITSLNELCGRYSKIAKLEMFERRQAIDADAKPLRKPSRLAQLHYTAPDFRWSEYEDNNNESPEQKAEAVKKAREIFAARSATGAQVARKDKR